MSHLFSDSQKLTDSFNSVTSSMRLRSPMRLRSSMRLQSFRHAVINSIALLVLFCAGAPATAQVGVTPVGDMALDVDALIMGTRGGFSDSINGRPFQQEALVTHGGYQFATWYHNGAAQDVYLGRRELNGDTWETIDTGHNMVNGNQFWDAHNSISMGISSDGRIHLVFDLHSDILRYSSSDAGFATSSSAVWNQAHFSPERFSLNPNEARVPGGLTYPRFVNVGDALVFTFREGGAPNGNHHIADYDSQTGVWSTIRSITRGGEGTGVYDDVSNSPSPTRNSYHNGFHADPTGRLHTTWTWREGASGSNHDIMYAYSDDLGHTWKNNDGQTVGTAAAPITLNSPGIEVVDLDRRQALINQQGQIVDTEGGVHILAYHRRQEPGFEWQPGDGNFFSGDSAYHHYYRNPDSGVWEVRQFPSGATVGSRPRIGVTLSGDLYGLYTRNDQMVIAGVEKTESGYGDWELLRREDRYSFEVTPLIDNQRLLDEDILSIFVQEKSTNPLPFDPTSSTLRVLEFSTEPEPPAPPAPPSVFIAGWETFASSGVSTPSQTDGDTTGTTAVNGFSLDAQLMSSTDETWGTLSTPAADATTNDSTDSIRLINGASGHVDFTITDTGGVDRDLVAFHFDSATFRPRSSRSFELSVIAGDLTIGTVASGQVESILGGQQDWSDFDIVLTSLADRTLDANGSVTFRLEFTGGTAGSGGHHQYIDNIAVTAEADVVVAGLLGDVDLNGVVDFLDISAFISVLSGGTYQTEADCDENGVVDFLDISAFIAILSGA